MSDRIIENLSVRKYIDIIMGIIRNKIIFWNIKLFYYRKLFIQWINISIFPKFERYVDGNSNGK